MWPNELDVLDEELGLSEENGLKISMNFIEENVRIPLTYQGRKIVVDEKALEGIWPTEIAQWIFKTVSLEEHEQIKADFIRRFNFSADTLPFDASELDNEAAEPTRTIVMADPEKQGASHKRARMNIYKRWLSIRHALVKAGAHVDVMETSADTGGTREVFTRDRYVMIGDTTYLPDARKLMDIYPKGGELREDFNGVARQIEPALKARGVKTVTVEGAWFEGGNVMRHFGSRTLFVGVDEYSTEDSAQKLLAAINKTQEEKWSLLNVPLTNPRMYHIDTGMSEELPHGEVLISPLLTDPETYQKICERVGPENVIVLSDENAKYMATNLINVGDTLIMTGCSDALRDELTARGYTVVLPADYGQGTFSFGRGGVHCMTNDAPQPVRKQPAPRFKTSSAAADLAM